MRQTDQKNTLPLALKPVSLPTRTTASIMRTGIGPRVSVLVSTFNHIEFIDDCIAGILDQKTLFPFEILVRDDASTDGTKERLVELAHQYPDRISLLLETQNTWGYKSPYVQLYQAAQTELLALCDGDDYWINPRKLQSQYDVLCEQKNCSLVFHPTGIVQGRTYENGRINELFLPKRLSSARLRKPTNIPIHSVMLRKYGNLDENLYLRTFGTDQLVIATQGMHGYAVNLTNLGVSSVFRRHENGMNTQLDLKKQNIHAYETYWNIGEEMIKYGDFQAAISWISRSIQLRVKTIDETARYSIAAIRVPPLRGNRGWWTPTAIRAILGRILRILRSLKH